MTEETVGRARAHAQAHAEAVLAGDTDALIADFAEEARPLMRVLGKALPQPVTGAEVLTVSEGADGVVAEIRYDGAEEPVVVRSTWADRDGRLRIVDAAPV